VTRPACVIAAGLLVIAPSLATAQTKPCGEPKLVVVSATTAYLTCERGAQTIAGEATLFDVSAQSDDPTSPPQAIERRVKVEAKRTKSFGYAEITFTQPVAKAKTYILTVQPMVVAAKVLGSNGSTGPWGNVPAPQGWEAVHVRFSTKPTAWLTPKPDGDNRTFQLETTVAIQPCAGNKHAPVLLERGGRRETSHPARLLRRSLLAPLENDSSTPPTCSVPRADPQTGRPLFQPERVASVDITRARGAFGQGPLKLEVRGVFNAFGDELTVPADKQKLTFGGVAKGKDDAAYFVKLAHAASPSEKPVFTADLKLAPVWNRPLFEDFLPTLNVAADVGSGATESAKTIEVGAGLTRLFFLRNPTLQAMRFSPVLKAEADQEFANKVNLILDSDLRFYFPWMNHGRAVQAQRAYGKLTSDERETVGPNEARLYPVLGFSASGSLGVEAGRVLKSTVEMEDPPSLEVPRHGVARLRARGSATLEVYGISVGFNMTVRYLTMTETVGRVVAVPGAPAGLPTEEAQLFEVKGAQVYGELTLQVALDRAGNVAVGTTYKRGSPPPTFAQVNAVQTGVTFKY